MTKPMGPKEAQLRALKAAKAMKEDGAPDNIIRTPMTAERREELEAKVAAAAARTVKPPKGGVRSAPKESLSATNPASVMAGTRPHTVVDDDVDLRPRFLKGGEQPGEEPMVTKKTNPAALQHKPAAKAKPESPAPKKPTKRAAAKKGAKKVAPRRPAKAAKEKRRGVPAIDVANFMARAGGASMDELVMQFGIDAHPMRAKVFYVRHTLGWNVETKDGRYYATAPKEGV